MFIRITDDKSNHFGKPHTLKTCGKDIKFRTKEDFEDSLTIGSTKIPNIIARSSWAQSSGRIVQECQK